MPKQNYHPIQTQIQHKRKIYNVTVTSNFNSNSINVTKSENDLHYGN